MLLRFAKSLIGYIYGSYRGIVFGNYDYNYLKSNIERLEKDSRKQVLAVGISYSLFGLEESLLKFSASNLSLPSQDLYYSYKVAQHVIGKSRNIKYCIIGSSYYGFHFDLSSSKNEAYRIKDVYYPILGDSHNCAICNAESESCRIKPRYNLIASLSNSYFNFIRSRNSMGLNRDTLKGLDKSELLRLGEDRAMMHNKLLKYEHTLRENVQILDELLNMLQIKGIRPIIVVFPAAECYRKFFSEDFKRIFYDNISNMKYKYNFELIDMFDSMEFSQDDFVDVDHLNRKGAAKATNIINNYLQH